VPGPACYDTGGTEPTVTDSDVALGLLDPDAFAGGTITLKPELSLEALGKSIGGPLDIDPQMSAYAVYEMVCENMASAARAHAVERGAAASDHTIVAFGGAAPLHVARVAEKIGAPRVVIPPNAGVGSAVGFLMAPVSHEVITTHYMRLDAFDSAKLSAVLNAVSADVREWVEPAARGQLVEESRYAFMRYVGQGHEITVALPSSDLSPDDAEWLRAEYETAYEKMYNRSVPHAAIEIVAVSVSCTTAVIHPDRAEPVVRHACEIPAETVEVYDGRHGGRVSVPRYRRQDLTPGTMIAGPAIIVEPETTLYATSNFNIWIDAIGSVVMDRKEDA
jgi:N-methylhydantoinase A